MRPVTETTPLEDIILAVKNEPVLCDFRAGDADPGGAANLLEKLIEDVRRHPAVSGFLLDDLDDYTVAPTLALWRAIYVCIGVDPERFGASGNAPLWAFVVILERVESDHRLGKSLALHGNDDELQNRHVSLPALRGWLRLSPYEPPLQTPEAFCGPPVAPHGRRAPTQEHVLMYEEAVHALCALIVQGNPMPDQRNDMMRYLRNNSVRYPHCTRKRLVDMSVLRYIREVGNPVHDVRVLALSETP